MFRVVLSFFLPPYNDVFDILSQWLKFDSKSLNWFTTLISKLKRDTFHPRLHKVKTSAPLFGLCLLSPFYTESSQKNYSNGINQNEINLQTRADVGKKGK